MSKLGDWLVGGNVKNMEDMSYEDQVRECLYRADHSKRYEEAQSWREIGTICAIMHLADILKGKEGNHATQ